MPEVDIVERLSVETPESVSFAFDLADLGSRGIAAFLDGIFLGLILLAEGLLALWIASVLPDVQGLGADVVVWFGAAIAVVMFATYWGYFLVGEVAGHGRTPGKRIVGIRVVRDDGSRLNLLDSVIRNLIRIVDFLPSLYGFGVASVLLSKRRKRLGDMAAGTVVVRDSGDLAVTFEGGDASSPVLLAREYLRRRAALTPAARMQVAVAALAAFGESPGNWDEPTIAGRLADLSGLREAPRT